MIAVVCLIFVQVTLLAMEIPVALQGRTDFRHFYTAGFLVRTGHGNQIYDYDRTVATEKEVAGTAGPDLPYTHPAYEALLFAGLSKFRYQTAFWIFLGISVALLFTALWLLAPMAKSPGATWPMLVVAGFLPVGICLIEGQDSIVLLALITASYVLQKSGKELAAGVALGLAAFRFQFLLPFVIFLIFEKRWKFLGGAAVSAAVAIGASLFVAGPESLAAYPRYLAAMSVGLHTNEQKVAMGVWPATMPNLRGFVSLLQVDRAAHWVAQLVTLAGSVGLLAWGIAKRLRFELMAVVAVLLSYHGEIHDSVLLLLPLLKCEATDRPWQLTLWLSMLVLPSVAFAARIPFAWLAVVYAIFLFSAAGRASGIQRTG